MPTLQQNARTLGYSLNLLASNGPAQTDNNTKAREFYEKWAAVNKECIDAGHETDKGDFAFVAEELAFLLRDFPETKTTIAVTEVFPPEVTGAEQLFREYLSALEAIAATPIKP